MAGEDRSTVVTPPEVRVAELLAARFRLQPPVDIEVLAAQFADIEEAEFPGSWDALLVQKKARRPLIVLSQSSGSQNRRRFSLAHELGHIVLPWSAGTMFCHAELTYRIHDLIAISVEAEANRFASELLFPRAWIAGLLRNPTEELASVLLEAAKTARVSPIVAALSAAQACPPDTVILIVNEFGGVSYSSTSPRSVVRSPKEWTGDVERRAVQAGATVTSASYGGSTLVGLQFRSTPGLIPEIRGEQVSSRELLAEILARVCTDQAERKKALHHINGVIGSANNMTSAGDDWARTLQVLRQRFLDRPKVASVTADPEFDRFLQLKALELRPAHG